MELAARTTFHFLDLQTSLPTHQRAWERTPEGRAQTGLSVVLAGQILGNELAEAFQVLAVEFYVVVPGPFHPQRLNGLGAALVEGQAMREVDHLVFCAMDEEDGGRDAGHFVDAAGEKGTEDARPSLD